MRLIGGPHDGREVNTTGDFDWLNTVAVRGPVRPIHEWGHEFADLHVYNARTGIYHHGRMPADTLRIDVEPFTGRRVNRVLDWLDRRM